MCLFINYCRIINPGQTEQMSPPTTISLFSSLSVSQRIIKSFWCAETKVSWHEVKQRTSGGARQCVYRREHCSHCSTACVHSGAWDFVIVIGARRYRGSKVASLSILPFSLLELYWEVSLLIWDNVPENWWGTSGIKAAIGRRWQGWTALLSGINSWRCSHVRQSLRPPTQWFWK